MENIMKKLSVALLVLCIAAPAFAQTTATEWLNKANRLYNEAKYKEAAEAYDKTISIDPKSQTAFFKAGWCYNDMEKYNLAIDRLTKAVALKKDDHQAWQELGYAYKKTAKNELALSCLNKAVEIKPTYALAYKQLGDVYQNLSKKDEAIAAYKKCFDNNAQNEDACYNLGYLYNGKGDYNAAIEWLEKAKKLKDKVEVNNEMGFAYYKLKKNDESIAAYRAALAINEKNGTAYKGIGDVYRRNYSPAKVAEAMDSYSKAILYNPKSSGSHFGLGWCYNEKKQYNDAIISLRKSLEIDNTLVAAYTELGYAYYMTGKNSDGLATLKIGLQYDNKNVLCMYYSGLIYIVQKDIANATIIHNDLKPLDAKLAEKLLAKINAL